MELPTRNQALKTSVDNVVRELQQKYSFDLLILWALEKLSESKLNRKNRLSGRITSPSDFSFGGRRFDQYGEVRYDTYSTGTGAHYTILDTIIIPILNRLRESLPLWVTTFNKVNKVDFNCVTASALVNPAFDSLTNLIPYGTSNNLTMNIHCLSTKDIAVLNRYSRYLNHLLVQKKIPLKFCVLDKVLLSSRTLTDTPVVLPGNVKMCCRIHTSVIPVDSLPPSLIDSLSTSPGHLETYIVKLFAYLPQVKNVVRSLTRFNLERINMELDTQ